MRLIIVLFSIISLFICALYESNHFTKQESVKWHERNQLYIDDFAGLLKPYEGELLLQQVLNESSNVVNIRNHAGTYTRIDIKEYSKNDITDISVEAIFNPNKSYLYIKNDTVSRDLLTHEEYHFHTTEAIARKIRYEIVCSIDTLTKEAIKLIYDRNLELRKSLGNDYDKFTNHSLLKNRQIQYQSKIDSMLAHYSAYSDPYIRNYKQVLPKRKNQLLGNSLYKTQLIRKDSLLIAARKDINDTVNLYRYRFIPLLAIDHLNIKNGQLQRVKAFFVNNGLFDPNEVGKTVSYSMQFEQNALDEAPHQYIPLAAIQDTAYISFIVNEDLKRLEKKEKFLSVVYRFNLNGKDTTFVSSYSFTVVK